MRLILGGVNGHYLRNIMESSATETEEVWAHQDGSRGTVSYASRTSPQVRSNHDQPNPAPY